MATKTKSRTKSTSKSATKKSASHKSGSKKRWSAEVTATSDATNPPEGLFKKNAATIARTLASKKVSPKGVSSGMRMLSFYINRAGHNLSATRKRELAKAKELLHARVEREKKKAA
jgi:tRNA(adenine34) deaminase